MSVLIDFSSAVRQRGMIKALLAMAVALVCCGAGIAQQPVSAFSDRLATIAGELEIVSQDETCKFNVTLNGKVILKTDCQDEANVWSSTPIPTIHTYYQGAGVRPFDEVVLLQMGMLGNACDGGLLLFLGLKKDKGVALSGSIDCCGGAAPVVTWSNDRVTVLLPGGPPNRGTGRISEETWVYRNGVVKQLKPNRKRR